MEVFMAKKITKRQLEKIINEEIEAMQNEGMFTSAIKTAATNFLPGGRLKKSLKNLKQGLEFLK